MRELLSESPMCVSGAVWRRYLSLRYLQFAASPFFKLRFIPDQRSRHRTLQVPHLHGGESLSGDAFAADLNRVAHPAQATRSAASHSAQGGAVFAAQPAVPAARLGDLFNRFEHHGIVQLTRVGLMALRHTGYL